MIPSGAIETAPASAWRTAWDRLPVRHWDPPWRRTVIVAPHPDDEVLGCGALIARQRRRGIEVVVLAVTDGEAAFDDVNTDDVNTEAPDSDQPIRCHNERAALAAHRRDEQGSACRILGVPAASVVRLGLPDGLVANHEAALGAAIGALVQTGDLVVAPWPGDHHCDHEATGRAVAAPAAACGAVVIGSLVWGPLHSPPLPHDQLPLLGLRLSPAEREQRWQALRCHGTQLGDPHRQAVVTPDLAALLHRPSERYVTVCP